jgi:hypothetical protein
MLTTGFEKWIKFSSHIYVECGACTALGGDVRQDIVIYMGPPTSP